MPLNDRTATTAQAAARFACSGGAHLTRVIPVNRRLGRLQLVSVELYQDGIAVRWISEGANADPLIRISDDCGTDFIPAGSGGFANKAVVRGESTFIPTVPSEAKRLEILAENDRVDLDLLDRRLD